MKRSMVNGAGSLNFLTRSFSPHQPTLPTIFFSGTFPIRRQLSSASPKEPKPHIIFSGIQPTGIPHLGNYLGALRQWVDMQRTLPASSSKLVFCIVDLHAITVPQVAANLRQWKKELLATLLAIGLDPKRCVIFEQSRVPQHSELMWILSCGASTGYLSRMTQWKSKLGISGNQNVVEGKSVAKLKLGLFSYPVLQAADILVHRATHVPVGEDQAQHLELTRELASTFHHAYGDVFPLPKTVLSPAKRVMSLRNPLQKMSKSDPLPKSRILLTDTASEIKSKIAGALTDSIPNISYDRENRPGVSNLLEIYAHMQRIDDFEAVAKEFEGVTEMKEFKEKVAECVISELENVRQEYERIMEQGEGYLEEIAKEGARKATESAEETMVDVRKAIGLL